MLTSFFKDIYFFFITVYILFINLHYKSFFKSIQDYNINPGKYKGKPKLPKYKNKKTGRFVVVYTNQAISVKEIKKGIIKLSKTNIEIKTDIKDINK